MPGKHTIAEVEEYSIDHEQQEGTTSSQPSKKRTRNARFTDEEKELLCRAVCEKYKVLFQSKVLCSTKKRIWEKIAQDVSSLSVTPRDVKQVQHWWRDTRKEVKEKASKIDASAKRTSGGPPCHIVLTPMEELVLRTVRPEVVVGVQTQFGADTAASEDRVDDGDVTSEESIPTPDEFMFPMSNADSPANTCPQRKWLH
ncbi:t-SNARE domain-containing protein 1-like [Rhinatrema bivittatum]|uniref:t-SNARE domain-containing protein 1-like n=1 Tax=Rhinatrema bivittatum TaxID=194408 RepID=UPI00112BFD33|nr:t-SNARE domain-containing protein 1-like [Rhinatrema bivittatum]